MKKKKSHQKLIIFIVVCLLIAGFGAFGWYIKKKMFNTDYVACYEKIAKAEKQYASSKTKDMDALVAAVKKIEPEAKVKRVNDNRLRATNFCDYSGVVTFFINGDTVMGRCAKHEEDYQEKQTKSTNIYRDAIYLTQTFESNTEVNNSHLQQATFYFEDGHKYGSWPQVKISGKTYAIFPYYNEETKEVKVFGTKQTNPYSADGTKLQELSEADAYYKYDVQKWYLGTYECDKDVKTSGKAYTGTDVIFTDDDD